MSRPKKKEVKFTKDSVLSILQEVYNEIVEQRNTALRIQNKMLAMMKEPEDMTQNEKSDFTIDDLSDDLMESLINKDVERSDDSYKLGK